MKTLFWILFVLVLAFYSADTKVTFKPFSISFEKPYIPFAIFFLILSVAFFQAQHHKIGYREGIKDGAEYMLKEIKRLEKEKP